MELINSKEKRKGNEFWGGYNFHTKATQVKFCEKKYNHKNRRGWGEHNTLQYIYPNLLNRLEKVEKFDDLKSKSLFSKASKTEWHEALGCLTGITGFPI